MIRWTRLERLQSSVERERLCAWLRTNGFDPARVPTDSYLAYDHETDEFIAEYYERPWRIVDDHASRFRVRRQRVAWLDFREVE